jgi:hypothetical protein
MDESAAASVTGRLPDRLVVEYLKSQYFRVAHVDGAIGGPTPSGHIHLALFSERPAIPRRLVFPLENGKLGDPLPEEAIVREGMIREMDIDLMMSVSAAEEIAKLLNKMVADMKAALASNITTETDKT